MADSERAAAALLAEAPASHPGSPERLALSALAHEHMAQHCLPMLRYPAGCCTMASHLTPPQLQLHDRQALLLRPQ